MLVSEKCCESLSYYLSTKNPENMSTTFVNDPLGSDALPLMTSCVIFPKGVPLPSSGFYSKLSDYSIQQKKDSLHRNPD